MDTDPPSCEMPHVWVLYAFARNGGELVDTLLELPSRLVQGTASANRGAEAGDGGEARGGRHPTVGVEPEGDPIDR